ncbi:hypothetical protein AB0J68_07020 [Micromonospora sp. NPDC049580]|uniref:hypothetical protein n=1 Tax=Micromonospora sp. NPDC049580 TaxID=3154832 RepID=UPI00343D0EEB
MGKQKRGKTAPVTVSRRLSSRDRDSLLQVLTAAASSPGLRHRWTSVAYLLNSALRNARPGPRAVGPAELTGLLGGAVHEEPRIPMREDFLPKDPRDVVLTRVGSATVRLFPGMVERPVADVARWEMVAQAADTVLVPALGFGIKHYVELALRRADHAISVMAPSWPEGGPSASDVSSGIPPALTDQEFAAAGTLLTAPLPPGLQDSASMRAATAWVTAPHPTELPFDLTHPASTFDRYLAVDLPTAGTSACKFWLPLAYIPEITGFGVGQLAIRAAEDPTVVTRFAQLAADRVRRALRRFVGEDGVVGAPDLTDGPRVSSGDVVQWLAYCGPRRVIAVQVVAVLDPSSSDAQLSQTAAVRAAASAARHPDRPIVIKMPEGQVSVPAGTEIVPLLVLAGAGHVVAPQQPGLPAMSLDDLEWAASTAEHDIDLLLFLRELAAQNRPRMFAWEAINIWEWWRQDRKTLRRGAVTPTAMMFEPHAGDAEWDRSSERADLERALAAVGLPPLHDWDAVEDPNAGPPTVYHLYPPLATGDPQRTGKTAAETVPTGWIVHTGEVPVAIRCLRPEGMTPAGELVYKLAGAIAFGLDQIGDTWVGAHAGTGVRAYRIDMSLRPEGDADAGDALVLAAGPTPHGDGLVTCHLTVDAEPFAQHLDHDAEAGREALAKMMQQAVEAAGAGSDAARQIRDAWSAASPTLVIEIDGSAAAIGELPQPWPLSTALRSAADYEVARAIKATGTRPGTYRGSQANDLDRTVLAPTALGQLTTLLRRHPTEQLLLVGMRQLARVVSAKLRTTPELRRAQQMTLNWDPETKFQTEEARLLTLRMCCETAVEATLREQPRGTDPVDKLAWMEIIAAAVTYLEATLRSEAVYHQVSPTALTISDTYEVSATLDDAPPVDPAGQAGVKVYHFDVDAFRAARASELLNGTLDAATDKEEEGEANTPGVDPDLDAAMLSGYGATLTDLLTTLIQLARWPEDPGGAPVARADRDNVLQYLSESAPWAGDDNAVSRCGTALGLVTSTTTAFQAIDWKPWQVRSRHRRVLIQPVVQTPDGTLLVAPHLCHASAQIYLNHLMQGQLPWSQPTPPDKVNAALGAYRNRRNTRLESEVAAMLRQAGYTVLERVKKPKPLGVPSLSGEIDVLAGCANSRTVWLLEIKDPAELYAVPEIRRHLDYFYLDRSKPCYATQLGRKYEDLKAHAQQVADALKLPAPAPGDAYEIAPMFVTRHPVPAAYVGGPYPFTTVSNLLDGLGR